jgi:hypothetical protein
MRKSNKTASFGLWDIIQGLNSKMCYIIAIAGQQSEVIAFWIVYLICNFSLFSSEFTYLINGFSEKDSFEQYQLNEKFYVIGFKALVAKKLRHQKH